MIIKSLIIKGFKSFEKEQTIHLKSLDSGLFLVTGENKVELELGANGVGKSSLFEALCWAFFGKTTTNLRAGDIENKKTKTTRVIVSFEKDERQHLLCRGRSPNSLTLDGVSITQEHLEKFINLNFDSFCYSVLISQFGNKFIDFKPSEKLDILTSILSEYLIKWDTYSDKSKDQSDSWNSKIKDIENELISLNSRKEALSVSYEDKITEWCNDRDTRIKELHCKISAFNKEYQDNKKLIDYIDADIFATSRYIERANKDIESLSLSIFSLDNEISLVREELIRLKVKLFNAETRKKTLTNIDTECPICEQVVSEQIRLSLIEELEKDYESDTSIYNTFTTKENDLRIERIELEKKHLDISVDIKKLEKQKNLDLNELTRVNEKNNSINEKLRILNDSLKEIEESKNPYEEILEDNKENLAHLETLISSNNYKLEEARKKADIYKFWIKGFKEIKLMLLSEAIKEFEVIINNYLMKLGMADWKVLLDIVSENKSGTIKKGFSLKVKSPTMDNEHLPFEAYSGGEGQRIRLATTLGLVDFIRYRRGSFTNLLILDEPTQFLSEEGIADLLKALKELTETSFLKVFLIDHRNLETFGIFNNILTVVKDEDGSKMLWQS